MKTAYFFALIFITAIASFSAYGLNLKQVLQKSMTHPARNLQRLEVEAAKEERFGAYLQFAPSLSAERSWADSQSVSPLEYERLSFSARLNLFKGFGDLGQLQSQRWNVRAQRRQDQQSEIELQVEVASLFFECGYSRLMIEEAQRARQIRKTLADIARRRYEKGSSSKDEYLKLQIDFELANSELLSREQQWMSCKERLRYWSGPFEDLEIPELMPLILSSLNQEPDLKTHPLHLAAQAQLDQSRWSRWEAQSGFWPRVDLSYSEYPETYFQSEEKTWFISAQWNLFDSGQTWTQFQLANIENRRQAEELARIERTLVTEFQTERQLLQRQLDQFQILKRNYSASEEIYKASLRRFQSGAISSNEVALDQNRVIDSAFSLHSAWLDLHRSWLQLLAAQGHEPLTLLR